MKRALSKILLLVFFCSTICGVFSSCAYAPYDYNLDEYIKVPDNITNITVTEDEIEQRLQENLLAVRTNAAIETNITSRSAITGDKVKLSIVGYLASNYGNKGSSPISALTDTDCTFIIGNGKYPLELERSIIGHYINDQFTVRITLARDFGLSAYASQAVVFEIKILDITELQLPLFNDAFVKSVSHCETVDEYKEFMRTRAEEKLIWEKLLNIVEVKKFPEKELTNFERNYVNFYTTRASNSGKTLEEYIAQKFFLELSAFHIEASNYSKKSVKEELLLYYLVSKYDLELTQSEYNYRSGIYVKQYGMRSLTALEGRFGTAFIRQSVQFDKVLDFLKSEIDNSKSPTPSLPD